MLQEPLLYSLGGYCGRDSDTSSKKGMEPAGIAQAASRGNLYQNEGQRGGGWRQGRKYNCLLITVS
jgi:hypothetical protein